MHIIYFLAILSVFFWSFNVIIGQVLVDVLTPWQISFFRWIIATILILPFTGKKLIQNYYTTKRHRRLILWAAFWGITFCNTCVYYAAQTVNPVTLSLIGVTGPLFLLFWDWMLRHKKLDYIQISGLIITLLGVGIIVLFSRVNKMGDISWRVGDLWMLGTAASFGFYSFLASQKPKSISQFSFLSLCLLWGTIFTIPPFIYDCINHPLSFQHLSFEVIGILSFLGIFSSFIAYLLWNYALEKSDTFKVGLTYYLMPVFSTLEAWILLGEKISNLQLLGGLIILFGIFLSNQKRHHL